jgi:hypothetical protein
MFFSVPEWSQNWLALSQNSFKTGQDGVIRTVAKYEFAYTLRQQMDCCKKYTQIDWTRPIKVPKERRL